ncbi:hypothetical protein [Arthrobacter sp. PAMC25284]|nr:hypothetical protein [Arthrobacter sp. PAMC25284]
MQQMAVSPLYVAAELEARRRWSNHEFGEAANKAPGCGGHRTAG